MRLQLGAIGRVKCSLQSRLIDRRGFDGRGEKLAEPPPRITHGIIAQPCLGRNGERRLQPIDGVRLPERRSRRGTRLLHRLELLQARLSSRHQRHVDIFAFCQLDEMRKSIGIMAVHCLPQQLLHLLLGLRTWS